MRDLAKYTHRSPDTLAAADLKGYFEHLVLERQLAPASMRVSYHGIRFLYREVLAWPVVDLAVTLPKRPQRIPELLTRAEVAAILAACPEVRYRTMLRVCYGCGLRLGEVLGLRVADLDGKRRLVRVDQGKGAQDHLVPLSPTLLQDLAIGGDIARPAGCSAVAPGNR